MRICTLFVLLTLLVYFLVIAIHRYLHIVDFMQHEYFAILLCSYMFDISHHALLNSICNLY
jgi:hypothetical protein